MKKVTYTNGQPYFSKKQLEYAMESTQSALRERIIDILTPGVLYESRQGNDIPFRITQVGDQPKINVGHGVSISGGSSYPVYDLMDPSYTNSYDGERIIIYQDNEYNTNEKTGNLNIPLNWDVNPVDNYIWIQYYPKADESYSVENKINPSLIYPLIKDLYKILVTTSNTMPYPNCIPIGKVTVPAGGIGVALIDQTVMQYADYRDKRIIGVSLFQQNESHTNGIVDTTGDTSDALLITKSSTRIYFKQLIQDDSKTQSVYIKGYRGIKIYPSENINYNGNLVEFAYFDFSTTTYGAGTYKVYIELMGSSGGMRLNATNGDIPSNGLLLAEVTIDNNKIITSYTDRRTFGVTGTINIQNNAITTDKIIDAAITESKIADNAVTTNKIKDGNVTNSKIADGSINNIKIKLHEDFVFGSLTTENNIIIQGNQITIGDATNNNPKYIYINNGNQAYNPYIRFGNTDNAWYIRKSGSTETEGEILTTNNGLRWIKRNITKDNFQTSQYVLYTMPSNSILHGIKIKTTTAFAASGATFIKLSIGNPTELDKYAEFFVDQIDFYLNNILICDNENGWDIVASLTYYDSNMNSINFTPSSSGECSIWLLISNTI